MAGQCWLKGQKFCECSVFNPILISFEETSIIGQFSFFSAFHWLPSVGKPHITPVAFVKTMES